MNKKSTPWIISAAILIILVGGGVWYAKAKSASASGSNYILGDVTRGTVAKKINATGTIQYPEQYNLNFDGKSKLIKVDVAVGDTVKAGQELAIVDNSAANQQVLQAKAALAQAQIKLNQLEVGSSQVDVMTAQDSLTKAQSSLYNAQQNLNILESYRNDSAALEKAIKTGYSGIQSSQGGQGGQSSQGGSLVAYRDQNTLNNAIQQAKNAVSSAQADYNLAKAQLDAKNAGTSSSDLQVAQLQVDQAQSQLNSAQSALNDTVLKAPVAGIIAQVNGKVGEYPGGSSSGSGSLAGSGSLGSSGSSGSSGGSGGSFIALMQASSSMQIVVPADEADIASIKTGQAAQVTLPAYPDKTFNGSVTQVSPVGTTQNNVTTFNVTITVDNTGNLMKSGMSANVAILIDQKQNVVVVPSEAVHGSGKQRTVLLAPADETSKPEVRSVQIGLDDGTNAEVISGLQDGDQVVIGTKVQRSTSSGGSLFGGSRGGLGGAMGGSGGYRGGLGGGSRSGN